FRLRRFQLASAVFHSLSKRFIWASFNFKSVYICCVLVLSLSSRRPIVEEVAPVLRVVRPPVLPVFSVPLFAASISVLDLPRLEFWVSVLVAFLLPPQEVRIAKVPMANNVIRFFIAFCFTFHY